MKRGFSAHPAKESKDLERPDKATLEKVRQIVNLFSHAVSAMRIYPADHMAVRKFYEDLLYHILKYLEDHEELELAIHEGSFSFKSLPIYQEENIPRSFPYLFFKDGMRQIIFLRGLGREELTQFLEIVRANAVLPPGQSDIVNALWERDFEFIRYVAPDEFLETRISAGEDLSLDFLAEEGSLYEGKIELTAEDREEVRQKSLALDVKAATGNSELNDFVTALDAEDHGFLESMLVSERRSPAEQEFLDLLFELLYLEEKAESFHKLLAFIEKHHLALVQSHDFSHAVRLLDQLKELKNLLADSSPGRARALDDFALAATNSVPIDALRECVSNGRPDDPISFFEYLKRLGPRLLPLGAEIFENHSDSEIRALSLDFLKEVGRTDIATLTTMALEKRPKLTKVIISILGDTRDRRAVPLLATFLSYRNSEIKINAVQALSCFSDDLASKVKTEYFQDPDERVRIAAASTLNPREDRRALEAFLAVLAEKKEFHRKIQAEKEVILTRLGLSLSPEALEALRLILMKRGLFARACVDNTRLAAVTALSLTASPESIEVLQKGARRRGRRVRKACREALKKIAIREDSK